MERARQLGLGDVVDALLAEEPHVAAQRDQRDGVLGVLAGERRQLGPEADRQLEHADVEQLGRSEVSELVDRDQHADEDDEPDERHAPAKLAEEATVRRR